MYHKKDILKIIYYLTTYFKGNIDIVTIIYQKKKEIEKYDINNELSYHYSLGLSNQKIKSNYIHKIKRTYYYSPPKHFKSIPNHNWNSIKLFTISSPHQRSIIGGKDGWKYFNGPLDIPINIIHQPWNQFIDDNLKDCNLWYQKIMLKSLQIKNFILVDRTYHQPSLRIKIKVINQIVKVLGILYLERIQNEFILGDIYNCIIISSNGIITSILGGSVPNV